MPAIFLGTVVQVVSECMPLVSVNLRSQYCQVLERGLGEEGVSHGFTAELAVP